MEIINQIYTAVIDNIYIVVGAFFVGVIITSFFKSDAVHNEKVKILEDEKNKLSKKLAVLERKTSEQSKGSSDDVEAIKAKYEALLAEANEQCEKLDKQLKNVTNSNSSKPDSSVNEQKTNAEEQMKALEKKIKALEEEIEENEDDITDLNKKIKNKDTDIADLQEKLGKEQKESKKLCDELSSVKATLEEKMVELKLKIESLDFVQEILSAPEVSHSDVKQLDDNIAEVKSFALNQLMDCYATLEGNDSVDFGDFDEFKETWKKRFYEWASVTRKSWINGKTTIAFVGEFSAGKTSIVNRILSQDDPKVPQLPVSTKATTAVATYIAGGPAVSYQFVTPDDKLKAITEKTFTEKVSKEVLDQVKGISSLIQYFVMTYKNPHLNGMSLLDTPGFNSNDKDDAKRTMEVINECDALFWVFDVNAGTINRSSINIIKEYLNKRLYVIINKVDTKAPSEVQKVEALIKKTLSDEGLDVVRFIKFSSKAPLSDIMNPIRDVKHLTVKDSYLDDLKYDISETLDILHENVKKSDDEYQRAQQRGNEIDRGFHYLIDHIKDHCEKAQSIPQFKTHFFSADCYEMKKEEMSNLCSTLNQSVEDANEMKRLYEDKEDAASEIQRTYSALCDHKAMWGRLNGLLGQYKNIQKKFQ